jgi:hypothetical protein
MTCLQSLAEEVPHPTKTSTCSTQDKLSIISRRWFLNSEKIQKKIKAKSAQKRVEIALFIAPKPVQCLCKWFDFVRSEISLR